MKKNKRFITFIILIIVISVFFIFFASKSVSSNEKVFINGKVIEVEIVDTTAKRARGLSNHAPLSANQGMLFVFEQANQPTFWMNEMLFPLDIIWIHNNQVVDLTENLPIPTNNYIPQIKPHTMINYALEVNAGFIKANKIQIGDNFEYKK